MIVTADEALEEAFPNGTRLEDELVKGMAVQSLVGKQSGVGYIG